MNRRDFLITSAVIGGSVAVAKHARAAVGSLGPPPYWGSSPALAQFVDQLPTALPVLAPSGSKTDPITGEDIPLYVVSMTQSPHQFHSDLPAAQVWGYNGMYLGPTMEARTDHPLWVRYVNNLPNEPLLPEDYAVADMTGTAAVRQVVHLHGGHVPPNSDGWPEDTILPGGSVDFYYPNDQAACMLWYHDHALGLTRINVLAGMAALWPIRDEVEEELHLPGGSEDDDTDSYGNPYEFPAVIQDKIFQPNGNIGYPGALAPPASIAGGFTSWGPEYFGDVALVNGKAWPYVQVEPRMYRIRFLNGSNARFYNLRLGGAVFNVIGLEQGFLGSPAAVSSFLIAPGERFDVLIDFAPFAGQTLTLTNDAYAPFPGKPGRVIANPNPATTGNIMQFRVGTNVSHEYSEGVPSTLAPYTPLSPVGATVRRITLEEVLGPDGAPLRAEINGSPWHPAMDGVTENPAAGATEVWEFINLTGDAHPMHVHLIRFQVLDRLPINEKQYEKNLAAFRAGRGPAPVYRVTGKPVLPAPVEAGWKDTVIAMPGMVTRIIATFDPDQSWTVANGLVPAAGRFAGKFRYPYHCHIVDHEDNAMMRPFVVEE